MIKVLAGKGSDIVLSFEDLTLDIMAGRKEATPKLSVKLKGSIRLDVDFVKAQETSSDTTSIVADKQTLRDLPSQVDTATTTDEIKAVWNDMLGDKE